MSADPRATDRRRAAALAGHVGDAAAARRALADPDGSVRATALAALVRLGSASAADVTAALADPDAPVRRRACAAVSALGLEVDCLLPLLDDQDPLVVEAACWAIGEAGERAAPAIDRLVIVCDDHADPLCREAAVAALGAIGHSRALPAILRATSDKPAIRRRAIIALAPFDGPEVTAALERALSDRDWQVRQAAEDLLSD